MSRFTPNIGLEKPDSSEFYDVGVFNLNADKIDSEIAVSQENLATHSTAITSHKALFDGKVNMPIRIPSGANLNVYTTPGMFYTHTNADAASVLNSPTTSAFALLVEKGAGGLAVQTLKTYANQLVYIRNQYLFSGGVGADTWQPWQELAPIKNASVSTSIPLTSGWQHYNSGFNSHYTKDSLGNVSVSIVCYMLTGTMTANTMYTITTLPIGVRPQAGVIGACATTLYSNVLADSIAAFGYIDALGNVIVKSLGSGRNLVFFSVNFSVPVI